MPENNQEIIDRIFMSVLEDSTFMFAEPAQKEDVTDFSHNDYYITYISFNGDVMGELFILFSKEMAKEFTMNMMGVEEEEVDESMIEDATMEFTNMYCGNVVFGIFGKDKDYDISIPVLNSGKEDVYNRLLEDEYTRFFMVDENPVLVNLSF